MPWYDKETVKQAASGRWPEVLVALTNVSPDILDGNHQACPKCGGHDRFRFIDADAGACLCNQCFSEKNGDGIAAVQWLLGTHYTDALARIAQHLGVKPEKSKRDQDPAKHLEFLPWNQTTAGLWCLKKKPIKPDAVESIGGRVARYRGQYTVIAIPVWGSSLREADPVGWVLYRADGGELPKWQKGDRDPEWVKVKLTAGSQQGVICSESTFDGDGLIWKTEGPTDLLAIISAGQSSAFTTANGAKEKPLEWIVKLCEGRGVNVCHDADEPGQGGATWIGEPDGRRRPGWCPSLATLAGEVRNVTLPFPIERKSGPDLRDFFNGGGSLSALIERASEAEVFSGQSAEEAAQFIDEAIDDPQRLARVNLERYKSDHDGRLVFWRDEWWKWKGGRYRKIDLSELKAKVWSAIRSEFERCWRAGQDADKPIRRVTRTLVSNVIGAMESICSIPSSIEMPCWMPDRSTPHIVATANGILDIDALFRGEDDCLRDHSPDWFSAFCLDYPFDPDADCRQWVEFVRSSMEDDIERMNILQEWAGYMLTAKNDLQRFLALEGEGGNGKTVFTAGMTAMLGHANISRVALEKFGGQFDLSTTIGKAANICGDVGEIDKAAEADLKQFTGGDVMQFDRKKMSPLTIRPTAKLIMSWNRRPKFSDRSDGLWRRMLLVPFNYKPPAQSVIRGMDEDQWWIDQGEAPGILLWAIAGLRRLRHQGDFTKSGLVEDAIADYRQAASPALEFIQEFLMESQSSRVSKMRLYELYQHFCKKIGVMRPLTQRNFGKEVRKQFPNAIDSKISSSGQRENAYEGIAFSSEEIFSQPVEKEKTLF